MSTLHPCRITLSPADRLSHSGNNDEKENLRIEKEFETAAAKGLRPCARFWHHIVILMVANIAFTRRPDM